MALSITRENGVGFRYTITEVPGDTPKTLIKFHDKEIMVATHIDIINQGWYDWMMRGKYIQDAFSFLTPGEREFLITGLLPKEWEELWKEED